VTGGRRQWRERPVHAQIIARVDEPHAVGSDHPHAVTAHFVHEHLLQCPSFVANLREAGGDNDETFDARRRAVVNDAQHRRARHGHDGEIDTSGRVSNRGIAARAGDSSHLGLTG
jgi:hypothetical protein